MNDYVAQHLGVSASEDYPNGEIAFQPDAQGVYENSMPEMPPVEQQMRRAAIQRLAKDGALLALSQRAVLGRLLSAKVLGVGGLLATAALLAPKAVAAYRQYFHPKLGTLQGAPLSPLLTNFYMTPFDHELTGQGLRLIRYCDDFVIQCRTEAEAQTALRAAEQAAAGRRLRLHPNKTRIVPLHGEFDFLGYVFAADGSVIPPPSVPEQAAAQLRTMARRAVSWRKSQRF